MAADFKTRAEALVSENQSAYSRVNLELIDQFVDQYKEQMSQYQRYTENPSQEAQEALANVLAQTNGVLSLNDDGNLAINLDALTKPRKFGPFSFGQMQDKEKAEALYAAVRDPKAFEGLDVSTSAGQIEMGIDAVLQMVAIEKVYLTEAEVDQAKQTTLNRINEIFDPAIAAAQKQADRAQGSLEAAEQIEPTRVKKEKQEHKQEAKAKVKAADAAHKSETTGLDDYLAQVAGKERTFGRNQESTAQRQVNEYQEVRDQLAGFVDALDSQATTLMDAMAEKMDELVLKGRSGTELLFMSEDEKNQLRLEAQAILANEIPKLVVNYQTNEAAMFGLRSTDVSALPETIAGLPVDMFFDIPEFDFTQPNAKEAFIKDLREQVQEAVADVDQRLDRLRDSVEERTQNFRDQVESVQTHQGQVRDGAHMAAEIDRGIQDKTSERESTQRLQEKRGTVHYANAELKHNEGQKQQYANKAEQIAEQYMPDSRRLAEAFAAEEKGRDQSEIDQRDVGISVDMAELTQAAEQAVSR